MACIAGIGFTTAQIMERISVLKTPGTTLICDINATMSCSDVLAAWQSAVLGPPNAWIGGLMFAVLGSGALSGVVGSTLARGYLTTLWGLAVFFLCFASWFMYQTAFDIGRLCLWCVGITTAVVIICACLTRIVAQERALGDSGAGRLLDTLVRTRLDVLIWAAWWVVIAALLWIGLTT